MNTVSCWNCNAEITLTPPPLPLPARLANMRPPRLCCEKCLSGILSAEDRVARQIGPDGWNADHVAEEPEFALGLVGVPKHLRAARLDNCPDLPAELVADLQGWAKSPSGMLLLHGPPGSGKSWCAAAMLLDAVLTHAVRLCDCRFLTQADYLAFLRSGYQAGQGDVSAPLLPKRHPRRAELLVLDDLAAGRTDSAWAIEAIGNLLCGRHADDLSTIITSNLGLDQIAQIDPRWASRLAEGGQVFGFPHEDLRLPRAGQPVLMPGGRKYQGQAAEQF